MASPPQGDAASTSASDQSPVEQNTKALHDHFATEEDRDNDETTGLLLNNMSERHLLSTSSSTVNTTMRVEMVVYLRDRTGVMFSLEDGHLARADELIEMVCEEQGLPQEAQRVFALWLVSTLMDLRLKRHHQPHQIAQKWDELCVLYTDAKMDEIQEAEPVLMMQRDVFYPKDEEMQIQHEEMLCLLYHEAKYNVVEGRYAMFTEDYHQLAGLQALIHLGRYNPKEHILSQYRANLIKFYPEHMYQQKTFLFFPKKPEGIDCEELFQGAHQRRSQEYANLDLTKDLAVLYRKYLEICWTYPFYGSAFFTGQIETPASRWKKLVLSPPDTHVIVAINMDCISLIDKEKVELILSVPFTEMSWDFRDTEFDVDGEIMPSLFIQFACDTEDSERKDLTKLLAIYSREAKLMDALINSCVKRKLASPGIDYVDSGVFGTDSVDGAKAESSLKKVTNKLDKFCLTTYTKKGDLVE
ncbi:putative FERM domain-containing protein FRMD8P1 isoform X4 [Gigantopelta aegis]|uniref:putative FERM domain-containing protein FRMD8P1 isoform X4 n=1 Tax=Gigantopelta aegis TaxID=1735272 RepID=UPI001B88C66E|nr:putative FERM domain-containing protein FRMD8P1 isoform X4 [Gigantopelta aegis]